MTDGSFISFEGGEGVGKTTQVALLADHLRQAGREVVTTREPGGTPGAEAICRVILESGPWDAESEALLMVAARRAHLVSTIWPALKRGAIVLSDRFSDSTEAYQGLGRGLA
ncbi:MAG: dTMP kinase, partial [Stellaceae bacterium]